MNEQVTIIALVDIIAALNVNSLEGNIYLMDNLRRKGSQGSGSSQLTTVVKGGYWCDGSQSYDIVLNWLTSSLNSMPQTLPRNYALKRSERIEGGALDTFGNPFDDEGDISNLSFLYPQISGITGQAVDEGVIFPAQYGTPIGLKNGWYWSATVDTNKTGIFSYTLHVVLYAKEKNCWIPVKMTHEAKIEITNEAQRNGFTNVGIGLLPLV
ncbi:MAG: hypothetical protein LBJ72_05150 [Dysgonamonadaceae bacterium]|jgi:hypothetical protein|nr:hypothetical protein [Dysgonamonadaceae bacterium]